MLRPVIVRCGLALLMLLAARFAEGQPPFAGPPGEFRGFRGRGFPGAGFPDGPAAASDPLTLLDNEAVRRELGLNDTQKPAIEQLLREYQDALRKGPGATPPSREDLESLTPEERERRWTDFRDREAASARSLTKEYSDRASKILTAEQLERLTQIGLQVAGVPTLEEEPTAASLKLSAEQRAAIRQAIDEARDRARESFRSPEGGPPWERMKRLNEARDAEILARLTPEQRTRFETMKGKPFDVQQLMPFGFGRGGPPGFGQGGPPGFGPGPMREKRQLVAEYDKNGDGWLNREERQPAREALKQQRESQPAGNRGPRFGGPPGGGRPGGGPPGFGPPGFPGREELGPAQPGVRIEPGDVTPQPDKPFYDLAVLHTIFLDFEADDWETELAEFHGSDVELPATLTMDGERYPNVGVHFRGLSSYGGVPPGRKRSLNVSLDLVDKKQRLRGYKTLNLLNAHEDPTFLHTVLYSEIARHFIPAPKANFVRVVINGESWGLYVNAQQFDKVFLEENYKRARGVRWKVPGHPGGRGGLDYIGDRIDDYKRIYEMKNDGGDKAWRDLIALCRALSETPLDQLEKALEHILDVDEVLWFLALENVLINSDGYWIRASDYSLYRDDGGKFHLVPHDMNETFQAGMGPGMGPRGPRFGRGGPPESPRGEQFAGPPGDGPPPDGRPGNGPPRMGPPGGGLELDPLVGLSDRGKPLRSRLLAVPGLRKRYLDHVRTLAEEWLDWQKLGPLVRSHVALIDGQVEADTRKLSSLTAFRTAVGDEAEAVTAGRRAGMSLKDFAQKRREYLLHYDYSANPKDLDP